MKNFGSLSMNILRIGLFLIFLGLLLPMGCRSNGFQIAQGILGNSGLKNGAMFLSPVSDIYGFMLLAVFITAAIGLIITFINKINNNFVIAFICLITSLVFMVIILMKLKINFSFNEFSFYIKAPIPVKIELLIGAYLMIIGYIGGLCAFILNRLKKIE